MYIFLFSKCHRIVRIIIDSAMTVLLLCAYNSNFARGRGHIFIGTGMIVLFALHIFINGHWFKNIFKGTYTPRRIFMTVVNILLVLVAATLVMSGLLEGGFDTRQIHTTAAYWFLPIVGVHLGLHWGMFSKYMKTRLIIIIMRILAFLFFAFGVWSFFDRDMFSKMFLGFSFDYWPQEKPIILFYAQTLSVMVIYVYGIYYLLKLIARLTTGNKNITEVL